MNQRSAAQRVGRSVARPLRATYDYTISALIAPLPARRLYSLRAAACVRLFFTCAAQDCTCRAALVGDDCVVVGAASKASEAASCLRRICIGKFNLRAQFQFTKVVRPKQTLHASTRRRRRQTCAREASKLTWPRALIQFERARKPLSVRGHCKLSARKQTAARARAQETLFVARAEQLRLCART